MSATTRPNPDMALMTSATLTNAARMLQDPASVDIDRDAMIGALHDDAAALERIERALSDGDDTRALELMRGLLPWSAPRAT